MTVNLYEWQSAVFPVEETLRSGLQSYLEESWMNRPLLYNVGEEEEDGEEKEPGEPVQRFLDFKPGSIKARNYVGFIQYGDVRINIEPKILEGRNQLNDEDKIGHLLKWLSYSRRFHFPFLESSFNSTLRHHDWLEAFIFLFANYTETVLSASPYMAYQELTEETSFVKGRLSINEYVQQNIARGRHHKVYCTYEPFVYDNLFNRVVKHTCRYLSGITKATENKSLLEQIIFLLDEAEDIYFTASDCDKVQVNRMFPEVERITNLCKLFLANQSYNSNYSDNNNLCVLLPMEVIFEEFVFGFMEKQLSHLQPKRQASDMYLAKTGINYSTNIFRMKHDILIPGKLIIDTKYKFREKSNDEKGGVCQDDLYQMIAYSYRRGLENVLMIYPLFTISDKTEKSFLIPSALHKGATLIIKVVSLDIIVDDKMRDFETELTNRMRNIHVLFN